MGGEGYSYSVGHPFTYKWYIKDIKSIIDCAKKDKVNIDSPEFSAGAKINDLWCLRLKIYYNLKYEVSVSISLVLKNEEQKVRTKYGIYLITNNGQKICGFNYASKVSYVLYLLPENKIFTSSSSKGIDINTNSLLQYEKELIQNDTLTVGLDLTVYDLVGINNPINSLKGFERKISDDLEDLLITKRKSDVVINVKNKKFDAHKFILAARSSVFDAMFSHNMKESKKSEITIPDIDPEVFQKLLKFIYTDQVEELDNFAEDLLEASDKYQLQGLREKCEDFLAGSFTIENVLRVMILADRHSAMLLKEAAITYILVNFPEVKNTDGYKELEKSQSFVAVELFQKYVEKIYLK